MMTPRRPVIAVIDDDRGILQAIEAMLLSLGYRAETYASATEFIESAMQSEAACLVVDIQLGDLSGIELGRHLLEIGLTFPIIFMTALHDETARRQAMEFGCVAYLQKPLSSELLMEAIREAIG
jgi:FixJ family two-component response regulator